MENILPEFLQIYNQFGQMLMPMTLEQALATPDIFYGVANIWLIDKENNLLCSLRGSESKLDPNLWQCFFGGKLKVGERHREAAIRELEEEIGLKVLPQDLVIIDKGFVQDKKRYFESYAYCISEERIKKLKPDLKEIIQTRWLSLEQYNDEIADSPDSWTGCFNFKQQGEILRWRKLIKIGYPFESSLIRAKFI